MKEIYDVCIVGAGAAGIISAITAARDGKSVLLLEKLPKIAAKLKATGGGRCNLSNTLDNEQFMESFGKSGRFMSHALELFDHKKLREFFRQIGVLTDTLDGFRIFPIGHSSQTVISALTTELEKVGANIKCSAKVTEISKNRDGDFEVYTDNECFIAKNIIISTGGRGYPKLGAEGDGYHMAEQFGHTIKKIHPAMMPLKCKEKWVALCRSDTISNAHIIVDIKKYRKLQAKGDLIFTKDGIRGPVVLDFSREITPLLDKFDEVPILINMTKGMGQEDVIMHIKSRLSDPKHYTTLELVETLLPRSVAGAICDIAGADPDIGFAKQHGSIREKLIRMTAWTPLTITGHDGFDYAMITRGGVSLKEIDSKTLQSKLVEGLYFCGEVMDLDGPCGGYNLQWAFSSGYLAGHSIP